MSSHVFATGHISITSYLNTMCQLTITERWNLVNTCLSQCLFSEIYSSRIHFQFRHIYEDCLYSFQKVVTWSLKATNSDILHSMLVSHMQSRDFQKLKSKYFLPLHCKIRTNNHCMIGNFKRNTRTPYCQSTPRQCCHSRGKERVASALINCYTNGECYIPLLASKLYLPFHIMAIFGLHSNCHILNFLRNLAIHRH